MLCTFDPADTLPTLGIVDETGQSTTFQPSFVLPNPVEASADGLALLPYRGPDLTVGGELNKLAANIALGRNTAGVRWRSDAIEGLKLGEAVALGILREMRATYHEDFQGFVLTTFAGTRVTV